MKKYMDKKSDSGQHFYKHEEPIALSVYHEIIQELPKTKYSQDMSM